MGSEPCSGSLREELPTKTFLAYLVMTQSWAVTSQLDRSRRLSVVDHITDCDGAR